MKYGNKKKMTYGGKMMKKMGHGGKMMKKMGMGGSYEKMGHGGSFGIAVTPSGKGAGSGMPPNFSGSCGSKRR